MVSSITWHQWHHTADIDSRTSFPCSSARTKASAPHGLQSISRALLGRGLKRNSAAGESPAGVLSSLLSMIIYGVFLLQPQRTCLPELQTGPRVDLAPGKEYSSRIPGSRRWHWGLLVARINRGGCPGISTREE